MPGTTNPRIRVRRATPADTGAIVRVHYEAFNPGVMGQLLSPDGGSEDARTKFGNSFFPPSPAGSEAKDDTSKLPATEQILVVAELLPSPNDSELKTPEVIAYGKWKLVRKPLPKEKWDVKDHMTQEDLGQGADVEVYNKFIGGLHGYRKKWMKGDPGLLLATLACSPARGRLGAGSAILAWGTELADREGKTSWLEASPEGYGLYRKFGFEDVDVQDLKVTEIWGLERNGENWGAKSAVALAGELPEGVFRTAIMRRFPKTT